MLWVTIFIVVGITSAFAFEKSLNRCPFCLEPRAKPPYGQHKDHNDCALCGYCEQIGELDETV